MEKHYSPRTPLRLVDGVDIVDDCLEAIAAGKRVGLLQLFGPEAMPDEPVGYAAELYSRLHDLDERGLDFILVEMPPDTPEWAAIRDRLMRTRRTGRPLPRSGEPLPGGWVKDQPPVPHHSWRHW